MKKIFALLAVVLAVVSCQKEINGLPVDSNNEAAVSLSVALPDDATRAAGADSAKGGVSNVNLSDDDNSGYDIRFILEVYNADGELVKDRMVESGNDPHATFNFRLIPGRNYKFVVWADFVNNGSVADLHYETKNGLRLVAIKDWTAIDESRDAYTAVVDVKEYSGSTHIPNIELTRPFAKLRVVTNDIKEMISVRPAIVTINYFDTDFYTAFDAFEATPIDKSYRGHELVVNLADDKYTGEKPDSTGVQTLFADYMFAKEGDRVKFTMDVKDNGDIDLPQVVFSTDIPVNRNHLTTVYGPILTDANNITVEIKPEFDNGSDWNPKEDEYDVDIWDGKSVKQPEQDADGNYIINEGAELAWIADQVNGVTRAAANTFKGKTIKLMRNINLGGQEWTPIGCAGKYFEGTFDGDDHIVGNFQITKQEGHAALFGNARATIKNLTVIDAKIVAHHYAGGIVGQGYVNMDKCHVNNIDITLSAKNGDWGDKAGGLVGQNCEGAKRITNSTAKNVKIQGYRDLGGIVGMAHNNNIVSDCYAENITILQDLSVNYQNSTPTTLGAVIGRRGTNVTETNNREGEGNNISVIIAEGVIQDTVTDIYTVSSAEGMQNIVEIIEEDSEASIVLDGDIDLAELAAMTRSAVANNWTPIGTEANPFKGTFDGNGKTIKNLALVESEAKEGKAFIGFFGYAKDATIKNVTFENVYINIPCLDIDHSQGHIGAVAGSLEGTSTIEDVTVKGDIKVYATQDANGASRVAVVAGGNSNGNVTMKNVHVIADEGSYLIANNNTGALAGQLQGKSVFENCSSNINVTVNKFFAGGIIGLAAGDQLFKNCHTTGNISVVAGREGKAHDHYRVGGIAGGWADGSTKVCTLIDCSYTGTLTGVNADGAVAEVFDYMGYVGRGYTLNGCQGSKVVIDGVSFIQKYNTAAEAGKYVNENGEDYISEGLYYAESKKTYVVISAEGLIALSSKTIKGSEKVTLGANIDLEGKEFNGLNAFNSENNNTFDGNNYTISNWTNNSGASDMGFIKNWVGPIKNVKFDNCHLKTSGRSAIVAAKVYGNIENVEVKNSSIEDSYWACGIIAGLYNAGSISNCVVTDSSVKSNGGTSAIVGVINETSGERNLTNCSVTNCTINSTGAYGASYSGGALVGMFNVDNATYSIEGCTVSNNTLVGSHVFAKYPVNENVIEK